MSILGRLLGYISMLANLCLALLLLGAGLVGALSESSMKVDLIPASPESMAQVLMYSGLGGLIAVVFGLRPGRLSRSLLVLWSLLVTGILICAFFRPSYRFDGEEHFRLGIWIFLGSLLLLIGSYCHWKAGGGEKRR
ncbi:MAG: hypothetical protein GC160_27955 [Acidobacteria bacterium]|nr:hypothetical protein [Acidobacteriota bacterium]